MLLRNYRNKLNKYPAVAPDTRRTLEDEELADSVHYCVVPSTYEVCKDERRDLHAPDCPDSDGFEP